MLPSIFGETKDPTTVQPSNAVQRSFLTNFQRNATNPLVGGIIGAVAAVLACIVLTFVFLLLVGSTINSTFAGQAGSVNALIGSSLTGNLLNFVALEHHATLALTSSASGISATVNITLPLTTLLIIPAIALILGGYIAAATDYSNQMRFVIGRAAAVGPFYGALLALIMALFGTQSASSDALLGTSASYSFGPTWPTVLLYGVLWGILFSSLGGFIKLFGSRWRAGAVSFLAQQSQAPWVAGLMGALAAVGLGILLMLPLLLFMFGDSETNVQLLSAFNSEPTTNAASGQGLVGLLYGLFGLPLCVIGFAFASGASLGGNALGSLPLLNLQGNQSVSTSLFDSHIPHGFLLVLLVPAIAYFFGGRVAARLVSGSNQGATLQAGALVGLFSAILMFLLSLVTGISFDVSAQSIAGANANAGIAGGSAFLSALVFGGVLGTLGAALYRPRFPGLTAHPLRPLFARLDALLQQPSGYQRPLARSWLYGSVLLTTLVAIAAVVLDIFSSILARTTPFAKLLTNVSLWGGLMLAVPALAFVVALAADLVSMPADSAELLRKVVVPLPPSGPAPGTEYSTPYAYPGNPPSMPQPPTQA